MSTVTHGKRLPQTKEQGRRAEIQQRVMARRGIWTLKEKARDARSKLARWIDSVN